MNRTLFYEHVTKRIGKVVIASTVREATDKEIKKAETLFKKGKCPHTIVYDEYRWPYWSRTCYTCGEGLGLV